MDWKKRIIRYTKRVAYPIASGCMTFFLVKGINFILSNLEPGWLIVVLMPIAQVALPIAAAFLSLCRRMYEEAEEDGTLEEILKNTPPLFRRRPKNSTLVNEVPEDICQEEAADEPDAGGLKHTEKEPQEITTDEEYGSELEQPSEPFASTSTIEVQMDPVSEDPSASNGQPVSEDPSVLSEQPAPEVPPTPDEQPVLEETDVQTAENTNNTATSTDILDPCNEDINVEKNTPAEQEPDAFDRIRDPDVMAHYIVLDIETTGLSRENDRIIEIAAIHYVFGEEARRFHTYIDPQMQIPKHITKLTGITQEDVTDAPLLEDIEDDFREFIKDYPLVGHNIVEFDFPFLSSHMDLGEDHFLIDTLDMSRIAFPLLCSHKLSNLNFWFNLDDGAAHRADADAAATNALMWACLYPDKYASMYRKAIRNGLPQKEERQKPYPNHVSISTIVRQPNNDITSGPLLGKKIVFTGELSVSRRDAMQLAVNAGALLRTSVSCKTDILVVGKQDLSIVGPDGMSGKEENARAINASGKGCIKIIREPEFMSMVSNVSNSDTK